MLKTSVSDRMMAGLRLLFLFGIAISVLPNGSVGNSAYYFSTVFHGLLFALTVLIGFRNRKTLRLYKIALVLVLLCVGYIAFQALSFSGNPFANPVWSLAAPAIGAGHGAISIAPVASLAAIPSLAVPFLVFMTALVLHQNDRVARALWRHLALFGAGVAVTGLVHHLWFPGAPLFGTPGSDGPSLTGNFVNRNNAAAFLALAAFGMFGLLLVQMTRFEPVASRRRVKTFRFFGGEDYFFFAVYALLFFLCLIALFLTQSRAGVGLSMLLLVITAVLVVLTFQKANFGKTARMGFAVLIGLGSLAAFGFFSERTLLRVQMAGIDQARWCILKMTLNAILDYPMLGTGFGAYREISPIYRSAECGIYGLWDRAHNSFLEGYLGLGLPFLILLLVCVSMLGRSLWSGYRERHRFRFASIVTAGATVYIALHSLVDFPLQIPGIAIYYAALTGAGVSLAHAKTNNSRLPQG